MKHFYVIENIKVSAGAADFSFQKFIRDKYRIDVARLTIDKKAIDARNKASINIIYRVIIEVNSAIDKSLMDKNVQVYIPSEILKIQNKKRMEKIIVIGAGPAGLFAALRLIEHGFKVCILERGKCVEDRAADVKLMNDSGILNSESNVLFGEGGAGTWSDGKLTTRINKPGIDWFFSKMVEFGAHDSILYDSKPHVGSDCLSLIVKNMREYIISQGSEIYFSERVIEFIHDKNSIHGVKTSSGKIFNGDAVILATGHSARDIYEYLNGINVALETKPFAVGCRVEHTREFINKAQYGRFSSVLPAADYRLVFNDKVSGRGVFSFCMCPGGIVINSSSEQNMLCVNGMSYSSRGMKNSNSAIVVSVRREDLTAHPLSGIEFQRQIEAAAFNAAKGKYFAPAIEIASFIGKKKANMKIADSSYLPGVYESDFKNIFPEWILKELIEGFMEFGRKIPGFIENGIVVGVETRTSSPVRILRNDNCESLSLKNLFPAGEGAGYAGGIVSSAVDGIKIADILAEK